jgi:hypothetical protein
VIERGVSKLRPTGGPPTIANQIILGVFEGVMTLLGLVVIVFPLALWAVPQQGVLANTVFYIVLAIGSGSFVSLLGLVYLKSLLFPERSPRGTPAGGKARLEAYKTWSETQDDARKFRKQIRSIKGGALHDFGYMARIASLLVTVFVLLNLSTWAFMHFYFGSTEVMSAEARWQLLHPDSWNWK